MAERLYAIAARVRRPRPAASALFDLYCGIGTIGLALAGDAGEVWGLESVPEAVADAEANAALNGIGNARFRRRRRPARDRPLIEEAGKPDVVVVDPPRAGLSKKIVRRVLECEAPRIVYVSCNPTTLAPERGQIVEAGYRLRRVKPVDMFPQTPHVECVALLERQAVQRRRADSASPPGSIPRSPTELAARCEELGYASMWANDHPGAQAASRRSPPSPRGRPRLSSGSRVMALDRHPPADINAKSTSSTSTATASGSASAPASPRSR